MQEPEQPRQDRLLPPIQPTDGASLLTCAAFHLGTPLVLARFEEGGVQAGWPELAAALGRYLGTDKCGLLSGVTIAATHEFRFPLGEPLVLRFRHEALPDELLNARTETEEAAARQRPVMLSHCIWVTPAGGVFLLMRHELAGSDDDAAGDLREWMEEHYAELTLLFLMVADSLLAACKRLKVRVDAPATSHERNIWAALCETREMRSQIASFTAADDVRGKAVGEALKASHARLEQWSTKDVLIDVHYMSHRPGPIPEARIAYDRVDLVEQDKDHLLEHLAVLYTAFPTAKWLLGALGDQSDLALKATIAQHGDDRLRAIQRMKLFCAALIAASQPIQIRIYRPMLVAMEENFAALRLPAMFDQIRAQIDTLGQETAALEARQRSAGDRRLSVALGGVTLLTALSSGFGVADFATKLGADKTMANGAMAVWIVTLAAVFLAFFRRWPEKSDRAFGERPPRQGR